MSAHFSLSWIDSLCLEWVGFAFLVWIKMSGSPAPAYMANQGMSWGWCLGVCEGKHWNYWLYPGTVKSFPPEWMAILLAGLENIDNNSLWSKRQACLCPIIKDLCFLSLGFFSYNAAYCLCRVSSGPLCIALWELGLGKQHKCWYSGYFYCNE